MQHLQISDLDAYAFRELSPSEKERVETHLSQCPYCRQWLRVVEAQRASLSDEQDEIPELSSEWIRHTAVHRFPSPRKWATIAAALLLTAGIGIMGFRIHENHHLSAPQAPLMKIASVKQDSLSEGAACEPVPEEACETQAAMIEAPAAGYAECPAEDVPAEEAAPAQIEYEEAENYLAQDQSAETANDADFGYASGQGRIGGLAWGGSSEPEAAETEEAGAEEAAAISQDAAIHEIPPFLLPGVIALSMVLLAGLGIAIVNAIRNRR